MPRDWNAKSNVRNENRETLPERTNMIDQLIDQILRKINSWTNVIDDQFREQMLKINTGNKCYR